MKKIIFEDPTGFIKVSELDIEKGIVAFLREEYKSKQTNGDVGFIMKVPDGGFGFYLPCGTGRSLVTYETVVEIIEYMTMKGWEFFQLK
jgi:hypothetical protein